jgi:alpha-ribazole phosphatase
MTKIFLIRHGETVGNLEQRYEGHMNSLLSETGQKDSDTLAQALKGISFSAVYSSDLDRSFETASKIADLQGLPVTKIPGIKERHYGTWEGLTFTEISQKWPKLYEEWLRQPAKTAIPKAETLSELQKRGIEAIESITANHNGDTICVVGHGGINRTILFYYLNLALDNFWRIKQNNCCINIIDLGERHPSVIVLNNTWFLGNDKISGTAVY